MERKSNNPDTGIRHDETWQTKHQDAKIEFEGELVNPELNLDIAEAKGPSDCTRRASNIVIDTQLPAIEE